MPEAIDPSQAAAVVTGATSGMGRAVALRLLHEGWTVLALDVAGDALAAEAHQHGARYLPCHADVRDRAAVDAALGEQDTTAPPLRAVVNAAGIYPPSTLDDYTEEQYRTIFDVNVLGTVNVIAAALGRIRAHGAGGAVVNFASADAFAVSPGQLLYSASKAAVVSITKSLALELAGDGVAVNAVAPGWVDTPGTRSNERMAAALASIPLRRAASPDEIAAWVWQLVAAGGGYLTGEALLVAGGAALR